MMPTRARMLVIASGALASVACTALLGVTDIPSNDRDGGATDGGVAATDSSIREDSNSDDAPSDSGAVCDGGLCPIVLAAGELCPHYLTLDSQSVFWTSHIGTATAQGAVSKCLITGCSGHPTQLTANTANPWSLTTDATDLYWGDDNTVLGIAIIGSSTYDMVNMSANYQSYGPTWVPGTTTLVFGARVSGHLMSTTTTATNATPNILVKNTPRVAADVPFLVATDGTIALYTTLGADPSVSPDITAIDVAILSQNNAPVTAFATGQSRPTAIVISNGVAYWLTTGVDVHVISCPTSPIPCTNPTTIYGGSGLGKLNVDAWGLAVDDAYVYWADGSNGTINRCPISGCPTSGPDVLASKLGYPSGLVADDTNLYWGSWEPGCTGGDIMKLPKPKP